MSESSENLGHAMEEWTAARALIITYEEKIDSLRKSGIAFVSALLTITAITAMELKQIESVVLISLICILLLGIFFFERNYRFYQMAAAGRIKILEPLLNLKLSEVIADWHFHQKMFFIVPAFYLLLLCITCALGFFVAPSYANWTALVLIFSIGVILVTCLYLDKDVDKKVWKKKSYRKINRNDEIYIGDWTIDKLTYNYGDPIRFTLTNLGGSIKTDSDGNETFEKTITFQKGDNVLSISDSDKNYPVEATSNIVIPINQNYSWIWYIPECPENMPTSKRSKLFLVYPSTQYEKKTPIRLKRTIHIKDNEKKNTSDAKPGKIELSGQIQVNIDK